MEGWLKRWYRGYCAKPPRRRSAIFHVAYFGLTAILFLLGISILLWAGRIPMWGADGLKQHFLFMAYIGQWIREAGNAVLHGQPIATFDFALGFGADVFQSLNYYGLGDPLLLLSAFFSPENSEICYILLIFLRYYLAGIAFLAYAKYMKIPRRYALPGALAYAFSMYMIFEGLLRHPFFANPLIHLPLIFLGAEKALRRESPVCLMLSVTWSALCGFYFFYINSLLLLIYALFRHFGLEREHPWRHLPANAGRLMGFYMVGLLIAAGIFLPSVLGYFSSARAFSGREVNLLTYAKRVYLRFLPSLVTYNGLTIYPTMPAIGVFAAIILLFKRDRAYRPWRWALALSLIFALVPFFGYAFNGFSYVAARWQYGALFLLCVGLSLGFPMLLRLQKAQKWVLAAFSALLCAYCLLLFRSNAMEKILLVVAIVAVVGSVVWLLLLNRLRLRRPMTCYLLALALLVGNQLGFHALLETNLIREGSLVEMGEAYAQATDSPLALAPECAPDEFWRVDISQTDSPVFNESVLLNRYGTMAYNSLLSGCVYDSAMELQTNTQRNASCVAGLDSRAPLEALWSVRYFVRETGTTRAPLIPYGFELVRTKGEYELYENRYALPLGYTTDAYITQEEYRDCTPLEKQWALLQGAVLEEEDERYRHIVPEKSVVEVRVLPANDLDASWEEGKITVTSPDARLPLRFEGIGQAETYLALENYDIDKTVNSFSAGIETEDAFDYRSIPSKSYLQGIPRHDFLFNAGYSEEAMQQIELYQSPAGRYGLENIRVFCQPMEAYAGYIEALREEPLEDLSIAANRIQGTVSLSRDKILILSIPFSAGWSAKVDGETAELFASGTAFTALKLEEGEHAVVLTYRTPGMRIGICLSILGVALFAAIVIYRKKRCA